MTQAKVGWEDILREAEDMYKRMTGEGSICWPPACDSSDTKVPPNHFGANLTQFTNGKQVNGNHKSPVKKNGKYKNGKGNHFKNSNRGNNCDNKKKSENRRNNKNAWKIQPPNKVELDEYVGQTLVYKKKVNRKVFQWCQKCGENRKLVLSHILQSMKTISSRRKTETTTNIQFKSILEKD